MEDIQASEPPKEPEIVSWSDLENSLRSLRDKPADTPTDKVSLLSQTQRQRLIEESFRVSAGSVEAQGVFNAYVGLLVGYKSPTETHLFFMGAYKTLDADHQRKIIDASPKSVDHTVIKEYSTPINDKSQKEGKDSVLIQLDNGVFEMEEIFKNPEVMSSLHYISELSQKGEISSKRALTDLCAFLGYYSTREWYRTLPDEQRDKMYFSGRKIAARANSAKPSIS